MNILGFSGLDASVRHAKKDPDIRPGEERMVQGLDSAATLISHGRIIAAAAEERFSLSLEKHTGAFPRAAIQYCLDAAGIGPDELDFVAHGFDYGRYAGLFNEDGRYDSVFNPARQLELWHEHVDPHLAPEHFLSIPHHLAHAASAYFPSGFEEALCVICDGMGEAESTSIFAVREGRFHRLDKFGISDSLGILYGLVTAHLGFAFNADEYKVMGLAPYGDPDRFRAFFDSIITLGDNGRFTLSWSKLGKIRQKHYRGFLQYLEDNVIERHHTTEYLPNIYCDFAAGAQACLEKALFHTLTYWRQRSGLTRLCMAGGVALNCTFNGKLVQSGLFDEVYVQPASGDDGTALGAALLTAHRSGEPLAAANVGELPFYGPEFTDEELRAAIPAANDDMAVADLGSPAAAAADAAEALAQGQIVAWFQGRMEYGPRALGNRSILANPLVPDIKDRLNRIIKLREGFRPFAPAVTIEKAGDYFDFTPSPTFDVMLATCQVRPQWRARLPGVTHIDGSARMQTVDSARNGLFHHLISCFGRLTGVHCVVNTSFNLRGQPIVLSPSIAIETFRKVRINRLYVGSWRLSKPTEDQTLAARGAEPELLP